MSDVLPEGTLVTLSMTVRLPCAATTEQVADWLDHNVAQRGSIEVDNPLYRDAPEPFGSEGLRWEDTGFTGKEIEFDHVDHEDGRRSWSVRFERRPRR